jgi:hypothetical protein
MGGLLAANKQYWLLEIEINLPSPDFILEYTL